MRRISRPNPPARFGVKSQFVALSPSPADNRFHKVSDARVAAPIASDELPASLLIESAARAQRIPESAAGLDPTTALCPSVSISRMLETFKALIAFASLFRGVCSTDRFADDSLTALTSGSDVVKRNQV